MPIEISTAARMARYFILEAANALAIEVIRWDKRHDLRLGRLAAYVSSSHGERLMGYASQEDWQAGLHTFVDADLGGVPQHSTLYHMRAPLHTKHGHYASLGSC